MLLLKEDFFSISVKLYYGWIFTYKYYSYLPYLKIAFENSFFIRNPKLL